MKMYYALVTLLLLVLVRDASGATISITTTITNSLTITTSITVSTSGSGSSSVSLTTSGTGSISISGSGSGSVSTSASGSGSVTVSNSNSGSQSTSNSNSWTKSTSNSGSASSSGSMSASYSSSGTMSSSYTMTGTVSMTLSITVTPVLCGNGRIDFGEQCDTAKVVMNTCCNLFCKYKNVNAECGKPSGSCFTTPHCDNKGICIPSSFQRDFTGCTLNGQFGRCNRGQCKVDPKKAGPAKISPGKNVRPNSLVRPSLNRGQRRARV